MNYIEPDECICDRLRAAEQRGYDKGWDEAVVRYVDGWADAVQGARDAVAALPSVGWIDGLNKDDALAAIDALKEE